VVAPVAALTRGDDKANPPVLPSPTQTATQTATHTIPGDFPLGDGIPMPGEATAQMERGKGLPLLPCRNGQSSLDQSAGWTDVATATNADVVDQADGTDSRVLALYGSQADAEQAVAAIAQMYAACTSESSGAGDEVAQSLGDGSAWLLTVAGTDGPFGDIVTVVQVGNAVLVQHDTLNADYPGGIQAQLADIRTGQAHVVGAMCVFATERCSPPPATSTAAPDRPTSTEPAVAHVDEIPSTIPIDAAYEDLGSDGEVHPPSAAGDPVLFDPCGGEAFDVGSQDQLFFQVIGPEYGDTRELRTYPSADEAVRQMEKLRAAVAACPHDPGPAATWRTRAVDTGYDSFAVAETYDEGFGGGVWLFTRVGRSILALVVGGEYATDNVWDALPPVLDRTSRIVPSMCLFTEAGC